MLLWVKIIRHAAVATQTVAECHAFQLAVQLVIPSVIDASQAWNIVFLLQTD
jgi:hypothetical protein